MATKIQSRTRVFPEFYGQYTKAKTELSMLDATVLNFSTTGCVLFYPHAIDVVRLLSTLKKALDAHPPWAGQLKLSKYNSDAGHRHCQGRLKLSYGSASDPGIEFIMAHSDSPMTSMIPPVDVKVMWDATKVDYQAFLDMATPLGFNETNDLAGVPSMKIQFTSFNTPGLAIAIGLLHPIADAQTLLHFTHDWAATNHAVSTS